MSGTLQRPKVFWFLHNDLYCALNNSSIAKQAYKYTPGPFFAHRCNFSLVSSQRLVSTQCFTTTNELIIQTAISDPPWSRSSATWQWVCLLSGSYGSLPARSAAGSPPAIPRQLFRVGLAWAPFPLWVILPKCHLSWLHASTLVYVQQFNMRQQGLYVSDVTYPLSSPFTLWALQSC